MCDKQTKKNYKIVHKAYTLELIPLPNVDFLAPNEDPNPIDFGCCGCCVILLLIANGADINKQISNSMGFKSDTFLGNKFLNDTFLADPVCIIFLPIDAPFGNV